MEQHAVPQHIAAFQFKLFGNLTVRQFVTLAIPLSLAAVIFFSNLPSLIRITLSVSFGAFGVFIALVPIQGRPFDKWIVAFIKALASPTQRIWVKEEKIPDFLTVVTTPPIGRVEVPEAMTEAGRQRLQDYLRALPKHAQTQFDTQEQIAIQRLDLPQVTPQAASVPMTHVSQVILPVGKEETKVDIAPKLSESLPQITALKSAAAPKNGAHTRPFDFSQGKPFDISQGRPYVLSGLEKRTVDTRQGEVPQLISFPKIEPKARLASDINFAIESIIPIRTPDRKITLIAQIGKTRVRKLHFAPPSFAPSPLAIRGESTFAPSAELKEQLGGAAPATQLANYPTTELPNLRPAPAPQVRPFDISQGKPFIPYEVPPQPSKPSLPSEPILATLVPPQGARQQSNKGPAVAANLVSKASIVPLTNKPNILSGIIAGSTGAPIEGAIIIVHDPNGVPVRALKTNKLGQFLSATPLGDGQYTVEVEAPGVHFQPVTLFLANKILDPVEIKAS